uniref:DAZ-associated protein 2 n=1 Tax=Hemiscolopendra marginata TaxID=943146 RepID=A0A646QIY7_9MYRI
MASFGSSDKSSEKKVSVPPVAQGASPYGFPTPSTPYATGPSASPYTQAGYAGYPTAAQYAYPQGPPPPYSVAVSQPSTAAVPGYYTYPQLGYPYPYAAPTQAGLVYPGTTYVVPGSFDAGARFDGIARPSIPPVPPGVAPTAAQLAMMQGSSVVIPQQKSNAFLSEGGGFTFW